MMRWTGHVADMG